jgi:hypothetical protein
VLLLRESSRLPSCVRSNYAGVDARAGGSDGRCSWKPDPRAVFYAQFELLDVYGPLEMFGWLGPQLSVVSVSDRADPVSPVKGPATVAEFGFEECPTLDLLLLLGGVGTFAALQHEKRLDFLRRRAPSATHDPFVRCSNDGVPKVEAGSSRGQPA